MYGSEVKLSIEKRQVLRFRGTTGISICTDLILTYTNDHDVLPIPRGRAAVHVPQAKSMLGGQVATTTKQPS